MRHDPSLRPTFAPLLLLAATCCIGPPAPPPEAPAPEPTTALPPWQVPPTRRDLVLDDYHGTQVADPYRWLESKGGGNVAEWIAAQNAATRGFLDAIPERTAIAGRLRELWNYPRFEPPERAGQRWFWRKNDGLQNQAVLYVADAPDGAGRLLLDPNALSSDGTVAVTGLALDEQGGRLAYAISTSGSDWREWHVLDVASGQTLADTVRWSKFAGAAWTHDGIGFFYQRYPAPQPGETLQAQNKQPQFCYHVVGTDQQQDRIVYERPDQPEWGFQGTVTADGRFLVLHLSQGTDRRNRVAYVDLGRADWVAQPLLMDFDATYEFVGNDGDAFFFRSTQDAPRGRVLAIDRNDPRREQWRQLVPQQPDALRAVRLVGDHFVCSYLADASSRVTLCKLDGTADGEIALPDLGDATGFTGRREDAATYFAFASFTRPPTILRYDFAARTCAPFRAPEFGRADDDLVSERVFPQSKDGTRLCLFLVHRRDLRFDGQTPCYLWGYGGFGISVPPMFRVPNLVWVERGGIYAQAVLRGGGEYGEDWHQAGMREHKQNVFDDFIACAEYLARNGYTSPRRLAIGGASNGGLLVGAVLTQRPDLFGAAIPEVGVHDLLRYQRFTIGWAWVPEYGSSDDKEQFPWLLRCSPLHNVKPGTSYPPTLVLTGDHDDRVLPAHSYKFAAALQSAQAGPAPILLRVETAAGHGAGKPTSKLIDEAADRLAFMTRVLRD